MKMEIDTLPFPQSGCNVSSPKFIPQRSNIELNNEAVTTRLE